MIREGGRVKKPLAWLCFSYPYLFMTTPQLIVSHQGLGDTKTPPPNTARGERACHEPQTKRCFSWDLANRLVPEFRFQRESALEHGKPR